MNIQKIQFVEKIIFNTSANPENEYLVYEYLFLVGHAIVVLNVDSNINKQFLCDMDNFIIEDEKLLQKLSKIVESGKIQ